MVKVSMSSTKYIIIGSFSCGGIIEKTDLIGSFFGQTEGLIGDDLEFANLQKTGKLGRIEISLNNNKNKSYGNFKIPTSLSKTEVSLVAATIESITKIGHCNGKINISEIKDERKNKRKKILSRAEELLNNLNNNLPKSNNIKKTINDKVKSKKIKQYGKKYFGGPDINNNQELILVEGRADVINMLKNNFNNVLSFNGSDFDNTLLNFCQNKTIILFLDDDNPGYKHLKELQYLLDIDYYTFAESGKEVEELTIKEIDKALKNKKKIVKNKIFKKFKKLLNKY